MKTWKVMALALVLVVTCSAVPAMAHGPRKVIVRGPAVRHVHVVAPRVVYRPPVLVPRYVPIYSAYPYYRSTIVVPGSYYYFNDPGVSVNVVRSGIGLHIGY